MEPIAPTGEPFLFLGFPFFQFNNKYYALDFAGEKCAEFEADPRMQLEDIAEESCNTSQEPPIGSFTSLALFPSDACNLRCIYCYAKGGERNYSMTPKLAKTSIDLFLEQSQELSVRLTFHGGGEPTLNMKTIRTAVTYLQEKSPYTASLTSNGTAKPELYRWLLDNQVNLTFSIDGPDFIQNIQRPSASGQLNSEKISKTVKDLKQEYGNRLRLTLRPTLTRDSLNNLEKSFTYFQKLGTDVIILEPMFSTGRGKENTQYIPPLEDFLDSLPKIFDLAKEHNVAITRSCYTFANSKREYHCGGIRGTCMAVTPLGDITSCFEITREDHPLWDIFHIGHINQEQKELTVYKDRIERLRNRSASNISDCSSCFAKHLCAGGCGVRMLELTNDLYACDKQYCTAAKASINEVAKRIIKESISNE